MAYRFNELSLESRHKAIENHRYDDLDVYIQEFNPDVNEIKEITSDNYVADFLQDNEFLFDVDGNDW